MILNLDQEFKPLKGEEIKFESFTFSGGEPHIKIDPAFNHSESITITHRLNSFNDFEINCLNDLIQLKKQILSYVNKGSFISYHLRFRGESDYLYEFGSSLKRKNPKLSIVELINLEEKRVNSFYEQIEKYGFLKNIPFLGKYTDDWTKRIQAQHAGVNTTLLDWSVKLETALFFATNNQKKFEKPGKIWIQLLKRSEIYDADNNNFYELNPKEISKPMYISPLNLNSGDKNHEFEFRRFKQKGEFSLNAEINQYLIKVVIPAKSKENIKNELLEMNISEKTLFHDKNQEVEDLVNEINNMK
jgi:hypothetical protein